MSPLPTPCSRAAMAKAPVTLAPLAERASGSLSTAQAPSHHPLLDCSEHHRYDQNGAIGDLKQVARHIEIGQRTLQKEDIRRADGRRREPAPPTAEANAPERHGGHGDQRIGRA